MATCPNKNLKEWKDLVQSRGESIAHYLWDKHKGEVPEKEYGIGQESVIYDLKSVRALRNASIRNFDISKNKGEGFFADLQKQGVPKDQIELVRDILSGYDKLSAKEVATLMENAYKFDVETITSKKDKHPESVAENYALIGNYNYSRHVSYQTGEYIYNKENRTTGKEEIISKQEFDKAINKYNEPENTEHYARLTVPGGNNYSENVIRTPGITVLPDIYTDHEGDFNQQRGDMLGWFRSDDMIDKSSEAIALRTEARKTNDYSIAKTIRRVLEIQSKFQKARDYKSYVSNEKEERQVLLDKNETFYKFTLNNDEYNIDSTRGKTYFKNGENIDSKDYVSAYQSRLKQILPKSSSSKESFIQLLAKDNNWVTFFIKSILQDSAKKGYEKVLFPRGETAAKVEGHQLVADELVRLNENIKESKAKIKEIEDKKDEYFDWSKEILLKNENEKLEGLERRFKEYKEQGIEKLAPIEAFYEKALTNILKKTYGDDIRKVKDEYGNEWNEVNIKQERDLEPILLQKAEMPVSKASPETLSKVREVVKKMGVNLQNLSDYLKGNPNVQAKGANALTDLLHGIIAIAEGKENIALTEEMVHVATSILEQKDPMLVTEMIGKIDRFSIYKKTLNEYRNDVNYQTKDGKPDIRKIKKEAVDKLITELIVNKNEGNTEFPELRDETNKSIIRQWWNKILDWFRGQYKKANVDVFNEATNKVMNNNLGTINDINNNQIYLQNEFTKIQPETSYRRGENVNLPKNFEILWDRSTDGNKLQRHRGIYNSLGSYNSNTIFGETNWTSLRKEFNDKLNSSDMEREQLFTHTLISLIRSTYGNTFNKGLAGKLSGFRYVIVDNPKMSPIYTRGSDICLNINKESSFIDHIFNNAKEGNEWNLLDTMVSEELIHLVSSKLSTPKETTDAYNELTQDDKVQILQTYFHDNNLVNTTLLKPYQYVHEYVRMQIQKKVLGWTTEETRTTLKKIIDKVWNYLKDLLPKYTSLRSIYDKTLNFIEKGEGELNENSSNEILGLPQIVSDAQKKIQEGILATPNTIRKVYKPGKSDPMFQDTEEADNWYERLINGKWDANGVKKRVTDRVKTWFKQRFPDKEFTPAEKTKNELKRQFGVRYHTFLDEIHQRYFNGDGTKRDVTDERPTINDPIDARVYDLLDRFYSKFTEQFFKDGKTPLVFSERIIYDPKQKEAGTLDLIVVDEDGKTNIIDWKFLEVGKGKDDIARFKQGAFQIQLGRYKEMLKDAYGIKSFGMTRAIPFLLKIDRENPNDEKSPYVIKGITAGNVDTTQIKDLRLMPVSEETESTGDENRDKIIVKLNAMMKQFAKEKTTNEEDREYKIERLNTIRRAIREIQGKGTYDTLIKTIKSLKKQGDNIISDWTSLYKNRVPSDEDVKDEDLSDFAIGLREYRDVATTVSDFSNTLRKLLYDNDKKEDVVKGGKELSDDIRDEIENIRESFDDVKGIINEFCDKFIGLRNLVSGILKPERVLKGLMATFGNITQISLRSVRILSKMVTEANLSASRTAFDQVSELMGIREKLLKKGGNIHNIVRQIYQKDDAGKIVNKLIYRYSGEFYDKLKENAQDGKQDKKWIRDNIDIVAYKKAAKEVLERSIRHYERQYKDDKDMMNSLIKQEVQRWDIDGDIINTIKGYKDYSKKKFTGWTNYLIDNYPLEKWESEEYKNLKKDEDLFSLYNFITRINEEARGVGYIDGAVRNTFLPFIRRSTAEALAWGLNPSVVSSWFDKLTLNADIKGDKRNELSGEMERSIPKYYTYDFTRKEDGTHDYSDVSEEIFKNMVLYINHMQKYKNLKHIEGQIQLLKTVEEFKGHLKTNKIGDVGEAEVLKDNDENVKTLNKFINATIYGDKYSNSDTDIPIPIHPFNAMGKLINRVAGREVFDVEEHPDPYSLIKCMDALNSYFRIKTLGFNVVSGAAVYFGSNMQVLSQAGKYFTEGEFLANTMKLLKSNRFINDDDRKMFLQLIDTFVPIRADRMDAQVRKAGVSSPFSRVSFNGVLMSVLTQPSEYVEKSIFMSLLDNMMVNEGKLVNITDFVNSKYGDRWESAAKHKEIAGKIKSEIAELKKTRSINSIKHLDENGNLVIPGFDLNNTKEIDRLTNLTRNIARTSTHGRTSSDINQFSMNVWTNSMQVFKTWIPKLAISRFQHFDKVGDDFNAKIGDDGNTDGERWDVGRLRLFWYAFSQQVMGKSSGIISILSASEKGVETMNQMYDDFGREYEQGTGEKMTMPKEEFFDLIRTNLRNEVRELGVLFSLAGALFATGFFAPGRDDDKAAKNAHNYYVRIMGKFVEQLSLFYNPVEIQNVLSGGTFPALGIFTDIQKFTHSMVMEITGLDSSNPTLSADEVAKKAQPIKYGMSLFPMGKAFVTYMSMFDADFAKEFNVSVSDKNQK
jgi:hypothetical protein